MLLIIGIPNNTEQLSLYYSINLTNKEHWVPHKDGGWGITLSNPEKMTQKYTAEK